MCSFHCFWNKNTQRKRKMVPYDLLNLLFDQTFVNSSFFTNYTHD